MDRLSPIDASFLAQERSGAHMHIGAVLVFEGDAPAHTELTDHIRSRLHLVPRYRQKLAVPRFEMGRPLWVDDSRFNLDYHVRRTALPRPGSIEQLRNLAGRVFSQRLDRSKPLWEMWLAEGLDVGTGEPAFAIVTKTHHSVVDGVSGVDLATVLFDSSPDGGVFPPPEREWQPEPEPTQAQLVAEAVKGLIGRPAALLERTARLARSPGEAVEEVREVAAGLGEVAWGAVVGAPPSPLNAPIGPHRRIHWVEARLDDFKRIKDDLGGTVNDVFLAVVSGALARWLRSRGVRTAGLELRGAVPVSVRSRDERQALGNRLAMMVAPLPVYADHPVERLRIVAAAMNGLRESKQALGAEAIANLQDFAPPTLLAQASRLNFSTRLYNLLVTNVPGPQFPLYLLGRRLDRLVPVAFLAPNQALAVAIMSYDGQVAIGLIADYDAFPELEEIGGYVAEALAELLSVAAVPG